MKSLPGSPAPVTMFGLEHWGIEPDTFQFAKAVTSGHFPLGGCWHERTRWRMLSTVVSRC